MFNIDELKFDDKGLIPAIIQENSTGEVLMMAYMNRESLLKTLETRNTWFWSRSRQELWNKGATSGNLQKIESITYDCDGDTLLVKVQQKGNACHTGVKSCFFNEVFSENNETNGNNRNDEKNRTDEENTNNEKSKNDVNNINTENNKIDINILEKLYDVLSQRKANPKEGSYTNYLFQQGINKILKKVGEESAEVIIAAKNNDSKELVSETSDLLYHLLVLLNEREIKLEEVYLELEKRMK